MNELAEAPFWTVAICPGKDGRAVAVKLPTTHTGSRAAMWTVLVGPGQHSMVWGLRTSVALEVAGWVVGEGQDHDTRQQLQDSIASVLLGVLRDDDDEDRQDKE